MGLEANKCILQSYVRQLFASIVSQKVFVPFTSFSFRMRKASRRRAGGCWMKFGWSINFLPSFTANCSEWAVILVQSSNTPMMHWPNSSTLLHLQSCFEKDRRLSMLGNKVWCDSVEGWYIVVWFCWRLVHRFCWRLVHCGVILLKLETKGDRWQLFRAVTAVEEEEEEEEKEAKKKEEKEKKNRKRTRKIPNSSLPPHWYPQFLHHITLLMS